jgi:hypothetical protein
METLNKTLVLLDRCFCNRIETCSTIRIFTNNSQTGFIFEERALLDDDDDENKITRY